MRPCTLHMVIGSDNSIVYGRHFYGASTIRQSVFGLVHSFVMSLGITNTTHDDDTRSLLRRIMAFWYHHFILQDGVSSEYVRQ